MVPQGERRNNDLERTFFARCTNACGHNWSIYEHEHALPALGLGLLQHSIQRCGIDRWKNLGDQLALFYVFHSFHWLCIRHLWSKMVPCANNVPPDHHNDLIAVLCTVYLASYSVSFVDGLLHAYYFHQSPDNGLHQE